ncbi:hypothetical protein DY000_02040432 [Brassica cretica]|uniref:Uncharacterized protein n=1 Tax=Brassica cretica TaxID=69181 RepID=A0ABQ7BJK7_BRACR|nr:hypothetical protein DY000_02040432 [Brassica cretica]
MKLLTPNRTVVNPTMTVANSSIMIVTSLHGLQGATPSSCLRDLVPYRRNNLRTATKGSSEQVQFRLSLVQAITVAKKFQNNNLIHLSVQSGSETNLSAK